MDATPYDASGWQTPVDVLSDQGLQYIVILGPVKPLHFFHQFFFALTNEAAAGHGQSFVVQPQEYGLTGLYPVRAGRPGPHPEAWAEQIRLY
jgi:hypothetical protein